MKTGKLRNKFQFPFTTARDYVKAIQRQDSNVYQNDFYYYRGGTRELFNCEQKIAELAGVEKGFLGLTTSGMSAILTAIDTASLHSGDIIIHSSPEYGQTYDYINIDLRDKGVIPVDIDISDLDKFNSEIKDLASKNPGKIKAVFLETIGNGPSAPVLDIKRFLDLEILSQLDPIIILDNTLPTDSIVPLAGFLKNSNLKVVGLESATKFYLLNQELGGFFFTYNNVLLQQLLNKRKRIGATPGPSVLKTFTALLTRTKKQFDEDNKLTMKNTLILAKRCAQAAGSGKLFNIGHPNLKNHPAYDYISRRNPDGSIPLFFITPVDGNFKSDELFYHLEELGAFKGIVFTESFGFGKTSVLHSGKFGGYIRVAGGMESPADIKKHADSLYNALSMLTDKSL